MRWAVIGSTVVLGMAACDRIPGSSWNIAAKSKATIEAQEAGVSAQMLDPGSAQFRYAALRIQSKMPEYGKHVVCGEVNGKNAYGGLVGFRRFISYPDSSRRSEIDPSVNLEENNRENREKSLKACNTSLRDDPVEISDDVCKRASEAAGKELDQVAFDAAYGLVCLS